MRSARKQHKRLVINKRTLNFHRLVAQKIAAEPAFIEQARRVLNERYENRLVSYGSFIIWQSILELAETNSELFKQELLAEDERMEQLRRQTIFVGVLSEEERRACYTPFSDFK